jgi:hypothetical protein
VAESRVGPDPEVDPQAERISTEPEDIPLGRLKRARFGRRLFFVAICGLLVAAALGLLGAQTDDVSASGGGYEVTVTYPSVTRPGLAVNWSVEIRHEGGFDRVVTVAVDSAYFEIFDENALDPDPLGATTDAERTIWTFEPPTEGDTMTVSFDARIEPGVQWERVPGTVAILEDGRPVATVDFKTLVLP